MSYPATHFCKQCNQDTKHGEVLVRKPSSYDTQTTMRGRILLFLREFINGGHYYNMDRYVTCKTCGHRELDNKGNEFE
ncbi:MULTISPECIES: hypothetical protein [Vibrio]|uniref:Uncharacterized protein n=3 Tax=Vibrio TaxID=662 RepID=A0A1B9QUT5_9VIBR|nr:MULTISPECIES: hypothetical protein [Vibrio]MCK6262283.1 hypothetical protein [Vibrio amylolyticus]OCH70728.1 hypothetical protein A6E14_16175 [Vibrio genomosp. F10]OEE33551.1 hypothetical protein A1QO_01275 [Vibrio genomosp. F10 str. ZF-129]OEE97112.1 hypothetical protein A1QM_15555 [Vibrio genomosp. F10 str. 9ZC157]OEF06470.1 hypothetical protein A1QK_08120 [Vibrio genomosp. F10 str. 9ZD137]